MRVEKLGKKEGYKKSPDHAKYVSSGGVVALPEMQKTRASVYELYTEHKRVPSTLESSKLYEAVNALPLEEKKVLFKSLLQLYSTWARQFAMNNTMPSLVEIEHPWIIFCDMGDYTSISETMMAGGDRGAEKLGQFMSDFWVMMQGVFREFDIIEVYSEGDGRCAVTRTWDCGKMTEFEHRVVSNMEEFRTRERVREVVSTMREKADHPAFELEIKIGLHQDERGFFIGGSHGAYCQMAFRSPTLSEAEHAAFREQGVKSPVHIHLSKEAQVCLAHGMTSYPEHNRNIEQLFSHASITMPEDEGDLTDTIVQLLLRAPHVSLAQMQDTKEHAAHADYTLVAVFVKSPRLIYKTASDMRHFQEVDSIIVDSAQQQGARVEPPTHSAHDGTGIEKFVVALGGLERQRDMELRAIKMSQEIGHRLNNLGYETHTGIARQPMYKRKIGGDDLQHPSFLGKGVNKVCRIAGNTNPNQILVTQDIKNVLEGRAEYKDQRAFRYKGFSDEEIVYELAEIDPRHFILKEDFLSDQFLFKERKNVETLGSYLKENKPVCIVGKFGSGKTTVLGRFAQENLNNYRVCVTEASFDNREPYHAIRALLEQTVGIDPRKEDEERIHTLDTFLCELPNEVLSNAQKKALRSLVSPALSDEVSALPENIPPAMTALVHYLGKIYKKPFLFCIEDVDESPFDKTSADCLYEMLARLQESQSCKFIFTKESASHEGSTEGSWENLVTFYKIEGLPESDKTNFVKKLADKYVGKGARFTEPVHQFLNDHCGSNPYLLRSAVRSLASEQLLVETPLRNEWEFARGIKTTDLKFGVGHILDGIESLKPQEKDLLHYCAILERNFRAEDLIRTFADIPFNLKEIHACLEDFCAQELLVHDKDTDSYGFLSKMFLDELKGRLKTEIRSSDRMRAGRHFLIQEMNYERAYYHFSKALKTNVNAMIDKGTIDEETLKCFARAAWFYALESEKRLNYTQVTECLEQLLQLKKWLPENVSLNQVYAQLAKHYYASLEFDKSLACYDEYAAFPGLTLDEELSIGYGKCQNYKKRCLPDDLGDNKIAVCEPLVRRLDDILKKMSRGDSIRLRKYYYYFSNTLIMGHFSHAYESTSSSQSDVDPLLQELKSLYIQIYNDFQTTPNDALRLELIRNLTNRGIICQSRFMKNYQQDLLYDLEAYKLCERFLEKGVASIDESDLIAGTIYGIIGSYLIMIKSPTQNNNADSILETVKGYENVLHGLPVSGSQLRALNDLGEIYYDIDNPPLNHPYERLLKKLAMNRFIYAQAAKNGRYQTSALVSLTNIAESIVVLTQKYAHHSTETELRHFTEDLEIYLQKLKALINEQKVFYYSHLKKKYQTQDGSVPENCIQRIMEEIEEQFDMRLPGLQQSVLDMSKEFCVSKTRAV